MRVVMVLITILSMSSAPVHAQENRLFPPGSPERNEGCADCYVQEASIRLRAAAPLVPDTNPACVRQASAEFFKTVLEVAAPRLDANLSGNLLRTARRLPPPIYAGLVEEVGLDFRNLLHQAEGTAASANCAPLAVLLPAGAEIVSTDVAVINALSAAAECTPPKGACPPDDGRFALPPQPVSMGGRTAVATTFADQSYDHDRIIRLRVAFRAAAGTKPFSSD